MSSINVGNRQNNRAQEASIINVRDNAAEILLAIEQSKINHFGISKSFGIGDSDIQFLKHLSSDECWATSVQKVFQDRIDRLSF